MSDMMQSLKRFQINPIKTLAAKNVESKHSLEKWINFTALEKTVSFFLTSSSKPDNVKVIKQFVLFYLIHIFFLL